ncbi:MAG: ATP-binding cassette domain-containing protein [Umezawaea sp.]
MTSEGLPLVVSAGDRQWTFQPGAAVRVGRGPVCDVVLDDPAVSRDHLRVEYDHGWVVRDQGTSGGTWFGGRRVAEHRVEREAVVRLAGAVDVVFRVGAGFSARTVSFGRAPGNDVVLEDSMVSRRHASARRSGDGWLVSDLGGLNPTLVNGVEVPGDAFVGDGDLLTFGSTDVAVTATGFAPVPLAEQHLVVDGVSFSLPSGKKLLSDVGIDIRPGELIAVVGPSGAGKSTLLKVMTGELVPSSGSVTYDGLDVRGPVRSRIGVVPQDDVLHLKLNARRVLSYAARLRLPADTGGAERRRVVADALAEVDLVEQAGTKVRSMSGGQRKRVSIAMELLTSPPLLLLDEPTSGLDPNLDKQIMGSLRDIADSGRSVVVVTHNPENLAQCDRILLLAPGGVPFFLGAPDELRVRFGSVGWAEIFEEATRHRPPDGSGAGSAHVRASTVTAQPAHRLRSWPSQALTLVARHCLLIAADPGYAAFLLLMPLVLAGLALAVPGTAGLGTSGAADPAEPTQMLVLLFVGAAFTGGACGAREIVAERAIFLRERAAGLSPRAYAASKVVVFGAVAAVQSALLVGGAVQAKPGPAAAVVLGGHPVLELGIALWLTAFASCAMALYASALVRSAEQVMPVLVVVVMAQLVLCGGMIPVTGRPVLDQLSWLTPSRWGYAAGASTVDVLAIVPGVPDDALWRHSASWWALSAGALVLLALVFVLLLSRRLTRLRVR